MKGFILSLLICIVLQFIFFIPSYIVWKIQCKEVGKENLAMSLKDRFTAWVIYFPIWLFPFLEFM